MRVMKQRMLKCSAVWCKEIQMKFHIQSFKVSSEGEECKRCSTLGRVETAISEFCRQFIGNLQKCQSLSGAVQSSELPTTVMEVEKLWDGVASKLPEFNKEARKLAVECCSQFLSSGVSDENPEQADSITSHGSVRSVH